MFHRRPTVFVLVPFADGVDDQLIGPDPANVDAINAFKVDGSQLHFEAASDSGCFNLLHPRPIRWTEWRGSLAKPLGSRFH